MTNGRDLRQDSSAGREVLRVLLVDDHAPVLRFLALAFKSNGCVVSTAASAEEAFDLLSVQPFDLVVSDIKMPGLSGLDVLRAVKGRQPGTPVVLITGMPSVFSSRTRPARRPGARKAIRRWPLASVPAPTLGLAS